MDTSSHPHPHPVPTPPPHPSSSSSSSSSPSATSSMLAKLKQQNTLLKQLMNSNPTTTMLDSNTYHSSPLAATSHPTANIPTIDGKNSSSSSGSSQSKHLVLLQDQLNDAEHEIEELTTLMTTTAAKVIKYQQRQTEYEQTIQYLQNENNQLQRLLLQALVSSSSSNDGRSGSMNVIHGSNDPSLSSSLASSDSILRKSLWSLLPDSLRYSSLLYSDTSTYPRNEDPSSSSSSSSSSVPTTTPGIIQDIRIIILHYVIPFLYFAIRHMFSAFLVWLFLTLFHYLLTQSTIVSSLALSVTTVSSSTSPSSLPATISASFTNLYGISFTEGFRVLYRVGMAAVVNRIKEFTSSSNQGTVASPVSSLPTVPSSILAIPVILSTGCIVWLFRYLYKYNYIYSRTYQYLYLKQRKIKVTSADVLKWFIDGQPRTNLPHLSEHIIYFFSTYRIYLPTMVRVVLAFYTACNAICTFSSEWCRVPTSTHKPSYERSVGGILQSFLSFILPTVVYNNNLLSFTLILTFTVLGIYTADKWYPLTKSNLQISGGFLSPLQRSTMMAYGLLSVNDSDTKHDDDNTVEGTNTFDTMVRYFSFSRIIEQVRLLGIPIASTLSSIIILQYMLRMDSISRQNGTVSPTDESSVANEMMILQQNTEDTVSYYLLMYWGYTLYHGYRSAKRNAAHAKQVHQYLRHLLLQKQNPSLNPYRNSSSGSGSSNVPSILDNQDTANLSTTITAIENEYVNYTYDIQQIYNILIGTVSILLWNFMYVWGIFAASASSSSSSPASTFAVPGEAREDNTTNTSTVSSLSWKHSNSTSSLPFSIQTLLLPLFSYEDTNNILSVFPSLYQLFFTCLLSITDIPQVWLMSVFISFIVMHQVPRTLRKR